MARVLMVDDDEQLLRAVSRGLVAFGHEVETTGSGAAALQRLSEASFDVVVSDVAMPGMSGVELLRKLRAFEFDLPLVFMTGQPDVESAAAAVELGALGYVTKPAPLARVHELIEKARRLHGLAQLKRQALAYLDGVGAAAGDMAGLQATFARTLTSVHVAFQPIVDFRNRSVYGYEALLRFDTLDFRDVAALLGAAERLSRVHELGRVVRSLVAASASRAPKDSALFVNLHAHDLLDEQLYDRRAPLTAIAQRVVLEITERATLDDVDDVRRRAAALRRLGYRIAVDDLGAGYAGLTSFASLEPEVVKLDMALVRDLHQEPTKQKLVGAIARLCHELGIHIVAEGIEHDDEREACVALGCDLLQGYRFARPAREFPTVSWPVGS